MKKNVLSIAPIVFAIIVLLGGTYAFFTYFREGNVVSKVIAGNIYMNYVEGGNQINLTSMFPESPEEARERNDNYTTFTISGVNTNTTKDVYYEILLNKGDSIAGKSRFLDKHLRFDLIETVNGISKTVVSDRSYGELNNTRIWVNTVPKNTTSEITITYELRMWLTEDMLISDTEANADYTPESFANSYGNIIVSVKGDFTEKEASTSMPAVQLIKSKVGSDGLVAINTSGALANVGDTIREYRYSGSSKYCTYSIGQSSYLLNVDIDTCPSACYLSGYLFRGDSEVFSLLGGTCQGNGGAIIGANQTAPLDGEVDNYVYYNDELWRIIGVFEETKGDGSKEELVKIVRDEPLKNTEVSERYTYNGTEMTIKNTNYTNYKYAYVTWNLIKYFNQTNNNDWTKASLQYYLNDETNGKNSYYNSINSIYQGMIETVRYNISNADNGTTPIESYADERSGSVHAGNQATWTGKIGLMYPSDYGYASSSENWNISMGDYGKISNTGSVNNWINDNISGAEWFISPSNNVYWPLFLFGGGFVSKDGNSSDYTTSPVIYLKSSVMIVGGDGSLQNPYQLS